MLIGLLHLKLKEASKKANVEKAKKLIKEAKERGAKLVILPSLFPVGNIFEIYENDKKSKSIIRNLSEKIPGTITDTLINLATEGEIHLVAGPILEQAGPKVFLTTLIISPQGEIIGKYRKVIISEKDVRLGISSGKEPVFMSLDKRYGILAEDDIFSPEINRVLALGNASAIIGSIKAYARSPDIVKYVAIARTLENGIPYILVGEVIEDENGEVIGSSPTFVTSTNSLIYKQAEDEDTVLYVETTVLMQESSKERIGKINNIETILQGLCKNIKKMKSMERKKINQEDSHEKEEEEE
ncbi:carbon-nitrogen hydrolase family protein [Stygiolobus azoricus]|uniref:Carbon-nitrogen hydrolase family protein n=1 Tax=Stygiolobus azoricus TaxID=41675 RepID=A0A650CMI2_9CREN|nr:carbon-nitrogen hydrolase family protein [Stygiolobus azoricus]QGR18978.1 carbon-nitrogen hydrolase family protein [Stygiolobus azoricus]